MKCNWVRKEGRCDGAIWDECEYCGSTDRIVCLDPRPDRKTTRDYIPESLQTLHDGRSLAPYQKDALILHLLDQVEELRKLIEIDK